MSSRSEDIPRQIKETREITRQNARGISSLLSKRGIQSTPRLTYQDYADLEGDGRYELLDGVLIPLERGYPTAHQSVIVSLVSRMLPHVRDNLLGRLYLGPFDVLFTDHDVVQPDVTYIASKNAHIITPENVQGAPDLVVEVLSPASASRDWREKRDLYGRHGVREYWILDPTNHIVSVLHPDADGVMAVSQIYVEGDNVVSEVLHNFTVGMSELFVE